MFHFIGFPQYFFQICPEKNARSGFLGSRFFPTMPAGTTSTRACSSLLSPLQSSFFLLSTYLLRSHSLNFLNFFTFHFFQSSFLSLLTLYYGLLLLLPHIPLLVSYFIFTFPLSLYDFYYFYQLQLSLSLFTIFTISIHFLHSSLPLPPPPMVPYFFFFFFFDG